MIGRGGGVDSEARAPRRADSRIAVLAADPFPDAFRPDLAMSLNNLSARLAGLGRREEALAAIEEAVTIRRELATRWPNAYYHQLERSLRIAAWLQHGESDASPRETKT